MDWGLQADYRTVQSYTVKMEAVNFFEMLLNT